jgi:DNA modification methylase
MVEARILVGDNRQTLLTLADQSIQTVITSPPYWGLRDYGQEMQIGLETTPAEFVEQLCLVFDEVWRVLKDDGTLWLNLGDTYCTIPHGAKGVNAPQSFEHKGSHNRGQARNGDATSGGGYANRKPLPGLKHKDLVGIPWRVAFALQERGWYLRQDIIWAKPNPMPESVTDRCTKSHEYLFLLTKSPKYFFDNEAIAEPVVYEGGGKGIRFGGNKYGDSDDPKHATKSGNVYQGSETRNKRDVWFISPSRYKEAHFATYPTELVSPCVLAGSKPDDWVLDPFSGSGTTGEVAMQFGRNYIGLELNPEYAALSEKRLLDACGLFGEVKIET